MQKDDREHITQFHIKNIVEKDFKHSLCEINVYVYYVCRIIITSEPYVSTKVIAVCRITTDTEKYCNV